MEIKIQSLESIHEAAREFIAAMGDSTVFALYGKWEPVRLHSSKPFVKNSVLRMSSVLPRSLLSMNTVRTKPGIDLSLWLLPHQETEWSVRHGLRRLFLQRCSLLHRMAGTCRRTAARRCRKSYDWRTGGRKQSHQTMTGQYIVQGIFALAGIISCWRHCSTGTGSLPPAMHKPLSGT